MLTHLHAGRVVLPDSSSPAHESGFLLLCTQASLGPEMHLGGQQTPGTLPSEPWALALIFIFLVILYIKLKVGDGYTDFKKEAVDKRD